MSGIMVISFWKASTTGTQFSNTKNRKYRFAALQKHASHCISSITHLHNVTNYNVTTVILLHFYKSCTVPGHFKTQILLHAITLRFGEIWVTNLMEHRFFFLNRENTNVCGTGSAIQYLLLKKETWSMMLSPLCLITGIMLPYLAAFGMHKTNIMWWL